MTKNELRKSALAQRQQYSKEECAFMSEEISERFFNNIYFDLSGIFYLHVFLPIENKNEVDTFPIFNKLIEHYPSIHIVLSKCDFSNCTMSHFVFTKNMELKKNKYGIPEPVSGQSIKAAQMDMVLVPLLAVDQHGNRLGYGKGFYDRFLSECRPECLKIGLSFEKPIEKIPDEAFDIPVDFCVTPSAIVVF